MLYYKVKDDSDQVKASIRFKDDFLIGGELYTVSEINKAIGKRWVDVTFVERHFDTVNIPPRETYFFFGARKSRLAK